MISDPSRYAKSSVTVAGVLGEYGSSGLALYLDAASAKHGIYTHAIVLADRDFLETRFSGIDRASLNGKFVVVSGDVFAGKARGSTSSVIRAIKTLEFFDP